MRIAGTWNPGEVDAARAATARAALLAAHEAGYTFFDHADIYCRGHCETLHGHLLKEQPRLRDGIILATKCGIRRPGEPAPDSPHRYDFSAEWIERSVNGSLERLQTDRIDVLHLHRPDFLADPDEVALAFTRLREAGKVLHFAVSNCRPTLLDALQRACPMPLIANQIELHPGRLEPFIDGTLDQCLEKRITPLAWAPLGRGLYAEGGRVDPVSPRAARDTELLRVLDATAEAHGVSRTVITLTWLMRHPSHIVPVVGSTNPGRIAEATRADAIELSREEWYRVLLASRGEPLP